MNENMKDREAAIEEGVPDPALDEYRTHLEEFQELRKIEDQVQRTAEDLAVTRTQLSSLEQELRLSREEEGRRNERVSGLFAEARAKEQEGLLSDALEHYLEILELKPDHARSLHAVGTVKEALARKEEEARRFEAEHTRKVREADQLFESGKRLYREGHFDRALQDFQQALMLGGQNAALMEFKERCEQRLREVEEAMGRAKQEGEIKQRQVHELLLQAHALERQEKFAEAILQFEKSLLLFPDHKEAREGLAQAERKYREQQGLEELARQEQYHRLGRIREGQLQGMQFYREGRLEEAVAAWQGVLSLDPAREDVLEDLRRAEVEIRERDLSRKAEMEHLQKENAARERQRLLDEEARRERELRLRAQMEEEASRTGEARESMVKRKYAEGVHLLTLGKTVEAMESFAVVMAENPQYESVERYVNLIRDQVVEKELRQREQEVREEEHRRQMQREIMEAALKFMTAGNYEGALPYLEKLNHLDPGDPFTVKELDHARSAVMDAREQSLKQRREEDERNGQRQRARDLHLLAKRQFTEGKLAQALELWGQALEQDGQNEDVHQGLKLCESALKEQKKRETLLSQEEEQRRERAEKRHFQALEALRDLQFEEAIQTWRRLLEEDPAHREAQKGILIAKNRIRDQEFCQGLSLKAREVLKEHAKQMKTWKSLALEADQFFHQGLYDKSAQLWNRILSESE